MERFFDSRKNRLIYVGMQADQAMWEERWAEERIEKLFSHKKLSCEDRLIIDTTRKYLPEGALILEGGCGLGNNLELLRRFNYEVIGVDYAEKTIERVRNFMPGIDARCGDLRNLAFDDGYFDGYWSLGVIEHFYHGYERISSEMYRVLKPRGYLFLTVPAMSQLRIIKARFGLYPKFVEDAETVTNFYQFAYSTEEIETSFCRQGFTLCENRGLNVYKGVPDEIPGTRLLMSALYRLFGAQMEHILSGFANHVHLFVFRKVAEDGL